MTYEIDLGLNKEISGACPIEVPIGYDAVKITGKRDVRYTAVNTARFQPVIGHKTFVDVSSHKWRPSASKISKVIIDDIDLTLVTVEPNFSVGSYGYKDTPEICCINNGSIECVEKSGNRIMLYKQVPEFKSDCYITHPRYVIDKNISKFEFDDKQRDVINAYSTIGINLSKYDVRFSPTVLNFLGKWLSHGFDVRSIVTDDINKVILDWRAAAYVWGASTVEVSRCKNVVDCYKLVVTKFIQQYNPSYEFDQEDFYDTVKTLFRDRVACNKVMLNSFSDSELYKHLWLTNPSVKVKTNIADTLYNEFLS